MHHIRDTGLRTECCILTGQILPLVAFSLPPNAGYRSFKGDPAMHSRRSLAGLLRDTVEDSTYIHTTTWRTAHCVSLSTVVGDHPGAAIGWCARVVPEQTTSTLSCRVEAHEIASCATSQECLASSEDAVGQLESLLVPDRVRAGSLLAR
ncbi:hypothetical protein CCMA1212_009030 [Trichoderma ghanense]|uniref:Uncharacterized protein n=1 Tax=Trichoderma ghanense TaxID=65468 RepID=A0ABY2GVE1_9HYPO